MSEVLNTGSSKNRVLLETRPEIEVIDGEWLYLGEVKVSADMVLQMQQLFDAFKNAKHAPRGDSFERMVMSRVGHGRHEAGRGSRDEIRSKEAHLGDCAVEHPMKYRLRFRKPRARNKYCPIHRIDTSMFDYMIVTEKDIIGNDHDYYWPDEAGLYSMKLCAENIGKLFQVRPSVRRGKPIPVRRGWFGAVETQYEGAWGALVEIIKPAARGESFSHGTSIAGGLVPRGSAVKEGQRLSKIWKPPKRKNWTRKKRLKGFELRRKKQLGNASEDKWFIENLVRKIVKRGKPFYEVKWKNYASCHNTIESRKNLMEDVPHLVKAFEASRKIRFGGVESLVKKIVKRGKTFYEVKWRQYDMSDNTIVSREDLWNMIGEDTQQMIKAFEASHLDGRGSSDEIRSKEAHLGDCAVEHPMTRLGMTRIVLMMDACSRLLLKIMGVWGAILWMYLVYSYFLASECHGAGRGSSDEIRSKEAHLGDCAVEHFPSRMPVKEMKTRSGRVLGRCRGCNEYYPSKKFQHLCSKCCELGKKIDLRKVVGPYEMSFMPRGWKQYLRHLEKEVLDKRFATDNGINNHRMDMRMLEMYLKSLTTDNFREADMLANLTYLVGNLDLKIFAKEAVRFFKILEDRNLLSNNVLRGYIGNLIVDKWNMYGFMNGHTLKFDGAVMCYEACPILPDCDKDVLLYLKEHVCTPEKVAAFNVLSMGRGSNFGIQMLEMSAKHGNEQMSSSSRRRTSKNALNNVFTLNKLLVGRGEVSDFFTFHICGFLDAVSLFNFLLTSFFGCDWIPDYVGKIYVGEYYEPHWAVNGFHIDGADDRVAHYEGEPVTTTDCDVEHPECKGSKYYDVIYCRQEADDRNKEEFYFRSVNGYLWSEVLGRWITTEEADKYLASLNTDKKYKKPYVMMHLHKRMREALSRVNNYTTVSNNIVEFVHGGSANVWYSSGLLVKILSIAGAFNNSEAFRNELHNVLILFKKLFNERQLSRLLNKWHYCNGYHRNAGNITYFKENREMSWNTTALHAAVDIHNLLLVKMLLQVGADVRGVDGYGNNVLHTIVMLDDPYKFDCLETEERMSHFMALFQFLLGHSSIVNAVNCYLKTPLDVLIEYKNCWATTAYKGAYFTPNKCNLQYVKMVNMMLKAGCKTSISGRIFKDEESYIKPFDTSLLVNDGAVHLVVSRRFNPDSLSQISKEREKEIESDFQDRYGSGEREASVALLRVCGESTLKNGIHLYHGGNLKSTFKNGTHWYDANGEVYEVNQNFFSVPGISKHQVVSDVSRCLNHQIDGFSKPHFYECYFQNMVHAACDEKSADLLHKYLNALKQYFYIGGKKEQQFFYYNNLPQRLQQIYGPFMNISLGRSYLNIRSYHAEYEKSDNFLLKKAVNQKVWMNVVAHTSETIEFDYWRRNIWLRVGTNRQLERERNANPHGFKKVSLLAKYAYEGFLPRLKILLEYGAEVVPPSACPCDFDVTENHEYGYTYRPIDSIGFGVGLYMGGRRRSNQHYYSYLFDAFSMTCIPSYGAIGMKRMKERLECFKLMLKTLLDQSDKNGCGNKEFYLMRLMHWGNRMVMQLLSKFGGDFKLWDAKDIGNSLLMCDDYMTRKKIILNSTLLSNWDSAKQQKLLQNRIVCRGKIDTFYEKLTAMKKSGKPLISQRSSSVSSSSSGGSNKNKGLCTYDPWID